MADILRRYGTEYLQRYDPRILPSHRKVIRHITTCRTPEMGGRKWRCSGCGKTHYSYHSCRDRHCPKCQTDRIGGWLDKQLALLLPVPYFLATVTVPEALRSAFRSHQKRLYALLFKASAEAIMTLASDKRFLGAQIGLMGILQTWTRQLAYHPHIHFLIPAGGMKNGRWKYAKPNMLIHVKPLSRMIRRMFRENLEPTDLYETIPESVWRKEWVCHIQPAGSGENALKYLAPYLYRGPLSDRNILSCENGGVRFRYRQQDGKTFQTCSLDALEFIRRFLQHVLPKGFVRVRYFGFLATKKRADLPFIKERIGRRFSGKSRSYPTKLPRIMTCPGCGHALLFVGVIPKDRGPP